jgi:hypothetical protein
MPFLADPILSSSALPAAMNHCVSPQRPVAPHFFRLQEEEATEPKEDEEVPMETRAEGETPGCRTEEGPRAADAKGKELLQSSAPPVGTAAAAEEEEEEEQQQQQHHHHHHHQNDHDMHSKEVSTINISELAIAENVSVYMCV